MHNGCHNQLKQALLVADICILKQFEVYESYSTNTTPRKKERLKQITYI